MPKTIHTPRDELVCGKLDVLEDRLRGLGLADLLYLTADIRNDCERMEAKLAERKATAACLVAQSISKEPAVTIIAPETYYYSPIPHYQGKVLKCQGLVSEQNRAWMPEKYPGVIELVGYRGDRIHADTHAVFA